MSCNVRQLRSQSYKFIAQIHFRFAQLGSRPHTAQPNRWMMLRTAVAGFFIGLLRASSWKVFSRGYLMSFFTGLPHEVNSFRVSSRIVFSWDCSIEDFPMGLGLRHGRFPLGVASLRVSSWLYFMEGFLMGLPYGGFPYLVGYHSYQFCSLKH